MTHGEADPGLTAVPGLRVGHWTDADARTGCTVVLAPPGGAVGSGRVLGAAPGTREAALLDPAATVSTVHALLLTGGSAFGLDAAGGVMAALEAAGEGVPTPAGPVPIVPAAVLYDLAVGRADVRPGAAEGRAATDAAHDGLVAEGAVGVGTGATVGKVAGVKHAVRSGVGSVSRRLEGGATLGVLAVSNAAGALVAPDGTPVAGRAGPPDGGSVPLVAGTQTTLVVLATDATLDAAGARALATSAHAGIARVTRPSHTPFDGDTTFVLATGARPAVDPTLLAATAQEGVADAILRGARAGASGGDAP